MEVNKKIKFEADNTQLNSSFGQVETKVKSMFGEMIRNARQYSTASREVVKSIEEQIRALDRKNKLELESVRLRNRSDLQSGELSSKQFKSASAELASEASEVKQMNLLLKELLQATRENARKELLEDRKNTEAQIRADADNLKKLGVEKGKEQEALKRTIQKGLLTDVVEEEEREDGAPNRARRGARFAGGVFNTSAGLAASRADVYMAAALAGMIPLIGHGLSTLMTKAFSNAEQLEGAMGSYHRVSGMSSPRDWKGLVTDWGKDDKPDKPREPITRVDDNGNIVQSDYNMYANNDEERANQARLEKMTPAQRLAEKKAAAKFSASLSTAKVPIVKGANSGAPKKADWMDKTFESIGIGLKMGGQLIGGIVDSFTSGAAAFNKFDYLNSMGLNRKDLYNRSAQIAPYLGTSSLNAGMQSLILERAFGTSVGTTSQMASMTRIGAGSMMSQANTVVKAMEANGLITRFDNGTLKDTAPLNRTLEAILQISQQQLSYSRNASISGTSSLMSYFQGKGYALEGAQTLTSGLQQGLSSDSNPQLRALQFATLSRSRPGSSLMDLRTSFGKIKSGNLDAITDGDYLKNFLGVFEGMAGGNQDFLSANLNQAFFGGKEETLEMVRDMVKNGGYKDIPNLVKKINSSNGITTADIKSRANASTGNVEKSTAHFNEAFAEAGKGLINAVNDLTSNIQKIVKVWTNDPNAKKEPPKKSTPPS